MIRIDSGKFYLTGVAVFAVLLLSGNAEAAKTKVLYSFSGGSDGLAPTSGLITDASGNFYSTTDAGGATGHGAVFKLTPAGKETVLYSFGGGTDGQNPQAGLAEDGQGNLYGTTYEGGADNLGAVFKVTPDGKETILHSFAGGATDGSSPLSGVILDAKGNIFGTAEAGGSYASGIVFEITSSGTYSVLYQFAGSPDGAYPLSTLLMDKSGNLFGTTLGGGAQSNYCGVGCGAVFELSPSGKNSWTESVIYAFQGNGNDTTNPWANVIADKSGNLYGTATQGGNYNDCFSGGCGAVFELSPGKNGSWTETILYDFVSGKDGDTPYAGVVRDAKGNLYGTTFSGPSSKNCAFYGCGS
ncbi:MAG TPA: choice-of-anchor tandem repeat GloVer-containing protein, partial [Rhizomicrobium sp.]